MRNDIHRPSAINPDEYDFVAFQYFGGSDLGAIMAMKAEREALAAHMAQTGGKFSSHEHGGFCHVCGCWNVVYACIFHHRPTNVYIETGADCAQKMDMSYDESGMSAFRRNLRDAVAAKAGKAKAQAILSEAGLSQAWDIYTAEDRSGFQYEEATISDIVGKLVRYGSISDKAQNFMSSLIARIGNRAAVEAQRKAETEAAAPCPTGRMTITGTVLSVKLQEGHYGSTVKMLVKSDEGWKVWGTCTGGAEKGDKVSFTGTIEPSKDDTKFGFFKRPTKMTILESKAAADAAADDSILGGRTAGDFLSRMVEHMVQAHLADGGSAALVSPAMIDALRIVSDAATQV